MRKLLAAASCALLLVLTACETTPKQNLLDANEEANATLERTANYVDLPACDATVTTGCHDPAVKVELKAESAVVVDSFHTAWANTNDATTAAAVTASNTLAETLASNNINCRPEQSCP